MNNNGPMKGNETRCVKEVIRLIDEDIVCIADVVTEKDKNIKAQLNSMVFGTSAKDEVRNVIAFRLERIVHNAKYALAKLGFDPERRDATDRIFGCKKGE